MMISRPVPGTIALCAGCDVLPAWSAVVVGGLSGPIYVVTHFLLLQLQIDDPLGAIPVHGAGGILGTLAIHLFKMEGVMTGDDEQRAEALLGLGWNCIGILAIWSHER